jgi:DNA adenine methylase
MVTTSPLRYPGGKARLSQYIWEAIIKSGEEIKIFSEPFCGGAGVSLALLEAGRVKKIALNDIDPLVASFWKVVFGKSRSTRHDINWLINAVESAEFSIEEWKRQRSLKPTSDRAAAWKCLYLNRTSFNGILHKAGPIGGWKQKNRTLDVRFNKERIAKRLNELYELRDQVDRVECMTWERFCLLYRDEPSAYFYFDPPYFHRAEKLYGYVFDTKMHSAMRDFLVVCSNPWLLSYDDAKEVRDLYDGLDGIDARVLDITYSANPAGGTGFVGRELVFSNRILPSKVAKTSRHVLVGVSMVGHLNATKALEDGPRRTPYTEFALAK